MCWSSCAQIVYSQYLVEGAPWPVQCHNDLCQAIYCRLDPPYEELFDDVEEYVLAVLYDAWSQMMITDVSTFDKVFLLSGHSRNVSGLC